MNATAEEMYNFVQRAGISLTAFQDWFNKAMEVSAKQRYDEGRADGYEIGYQDCADNYKLNV